MKKYLMAFLSGIIISGAIAAACLWKGLSNYEAGFVGILSSIGAIILFQFTQDIEGDFYITFYYGIGAMVVPILINLL